ncbi:MAG: response regulator, partial [Armatimonadetes bacterium]|nr:response regulator [Armatimonadota bacterium]
MTNSAKKKILITEDDGFLRDLTSIVLRKQGYEVAQARDGEEALEVVPTLMPDLILMDVNMPDVDGFTVARRLR